MTSRESMQCMFRIAAAALALLPFASRADCTPVTYRKMRPPVYPSAAAAEHVQGTALAMAQVNEAGIPTGVNLHQSSGDDRLDAAAISAVADWEFNPSICEGKVVASRTVVPVAFQFDPAAEPERRVTEKDEQPVDGKNPDDVLAALRLDPAIAASERTVRIDHDTTIVSFIDPAQRSMWEVLQSSASGATWISMIRLRFVHVSQSTTRQLYSQICKGSVPWCERHLADYLRLLERIPPPLPPATETIPER